MTRKAGSTKTRKAKGRRLQQWVADVIKREAGAPADQVKVAIMGESGPDVTFLSFCVECSNAEQLNIFKKIEQCERNAEIYREGKPYDVLPIVAFKKNNTKIYGAIEFEILIKALTLAAEGHLMKKAMLEQAQLQQTSMVKAGNA
jgi:hypothetical protein